MLRSTQLCLLSRSAGASCENRRDLSAALVALRSLRAESRNEEKKGHQDARPACRTGSRSRCRHCGKDRLRRIVAMRRVLLKFEWRQYW